MYELKYCIDTANIHIYVGVVWRRSCFQITNFFNFFFLNKQSWCKLDYTKYIPLTNFLICSFLHIYYFKLVNIYSYTHPLTQDIDDNDPIMLPQASGGKSLQVHIGQPLTSSVEPVVTYRNTEDVNKGWFKWRETSISSW